MSPEIIEKVMIWILTERTNNVKEVECLLYWILCKFCFIIPSNMGFQIIIYSFLGLLDYQLAPKNVVNEFYGLLWPLLEQYVSVMMNFS